MTMTITSSSVVQGPPLEENPDLHWQIRQDRERYRSGQAVKDVKTFRRYAMGAQPNNLTDKQKETLKGLTGNKFSDNVCDSIIRQARGRLLMQEFTAEDTATKDYLDTVYKYCMVRQRSGEIHYDSLRDGNMVVALGWNNLKKRVQLTMEPWYDGEEGVYIAYDFDGNPIYGVKDWKDVIYTGVQNQKNQKPVGTIFRNLYWPDRLERWKSLDGGTTWTPRPLDITQANGTTVSEPWPVPWLKNDRTPLGIPYVHFLNAGRGSGFYGWSELDSGVLGFQDQINDLQWALSGAGRLTAFQIYWIAGVTGDADASVSPGQVWKFTKSDTKVGVLAPADMTQLLKILEFKLARVSQMTDTPLHYITGGDWPSGEALLRAEQPAVAKAEVQIDRFQPAWGDVGVMAVKLSNRFGGTAFPEDADKNSISSTFASPERRDPLSKSVIIMNLGDKISNEEALRMMDFDDEKVKQITDEKDAAAKKQQDLFSSSFNRGVGPGTDLPGRGAPGGATPPKPGFQIPKGPSQVPKPPNG